MWGVAVINYTKFQKLKSEVGEGIINELIKHFIDELTRQQEQLHCYAADIDNNQKQINDVLHILKNTTNMYGADSLFHMANDNYEKGEVSKVALLEICSEITCSVTSYEKLVQRG